MTPAQLIVGTVLVYLAGVVAGWALRWFFEQDYDGSPY